MIIDYLTFYKLPYSKIKKLMLLAEIVKKEKVEIATMGQLAALMGGK